MGQRSCLSEDEALAHVRGRTGQREATDVQEHLDGCVNCRVLVSEAARGVSGDEGDPVPGAPLTLSIGQLLAVRYRILRFVARGGMGEVYEAHDSVLGETVALKTLALTSLDSPQALSRLVAEVRLARQVTNPRVCRIFELGFHRPPDAGAGRPAEPIPFLTMQYLRGENLHQKIRREGPLPTETVQAILRQIVAGLAAIHAAGIVHRDIKPQNIMLLEGPELRVVLTDFGLARALAPGAGSGTTGRFVVGTHEYMSPEQLESKPPRPAFDLYALGVVIFEMLTGRYPFAGLTVLQRVLAAPPRPSQIRPGLDPAWDRVVAGCLANEPHQRFARVEQILQTAPAPPRPRPARRRRARLIAAASLLALAALGFAGVRLHHVVRSRAPAAGTR